MEYLDIINEKDEIIGREERTIVHEKGLLHREIHIWFFDSKENIIFQKRGVEKSSGGLLDATIGGHVDSGETYVQTALREGFEESGIQLKEGKLVHIGKLRETLDLDGAKKKNNFIRMIFLYTEPIEINEMKREEGVKGVDFITYDLNQLENIDTLDGRFDQLILEKEVPMISSFLETKV